MGSTPEAVADGCSGGAAAAARHAGMQEGEGVSQPSITSTGSKAAAMASCGAAPAACQGHNGLPAAWPCVVQCRLAVCQSAHTAHFDPPNSHPGVVRTTQMHTAPPHRAAAAVSLAAEGSGRACEVTGRLQHKGRRHAQRAFVGRTAEVESATQQSAVLGSLLAPGNAHEAGGALAEPGTDSRHPRK